MSSRSRQKYVALSYTWGPPLPPKDDADARAQNAPASIICDDSTMQISMNLYNAMRTLCKLGVKDWLWIDAISINQLDQEERSQQVQVMGSIFSRAATVFVWLGPPDEHADFSLPLINGLGQVIKEKHDDRMDERRHRRSRSRSLSFDLTRLLSKNEWDHLKAFFMRSWFQRLWVVQEIVLAQNVTVIYNDCTFDWVPILRFANCMQLANYAAQFGGVVQGLEGVALISKIQNYVKNHPAVAEHSELDRDSLSAHAIDFFMLLVCLCRDRQTTDQRDKIYGPWALVVKVMEGKQEPFLTPDYNKTTVEVFEEATALFLQQGKDLYFLSMVEAPVEKYTPNLPSWVPDLSVTAPSPVLVEKNFDVTQGWQKPRQQVHHDSIQHYLMVHGVACDSIVEIFDSVANVLPPHAVCRLLQWLCTPAVLSSKRPVLRCLLDTLSAQPHEVDEDLIESFTEWLKTKIVLCYRNALSMKTDLTPREWWYDHDEIARLQDFDQFCPKREELERTFRHWEGQGHKSATIPSNGASNVSSMQFDDFISSAVQQRYLFRTVDGAVGLGSKSCKAGDEIWLIRGGKVPYALRRLENGHHQFIGEAYVSGFMRGEFSTDVKERDSKHIILE